VSSTGSGVAHTLTRVTVGASALATGWVGLAGLFSDFGPHERLVGRIGVVAAAYVVGCGLIGALVPRRWYVAVSGAWGPVLLSTFMLGAVALRLGEPAAAPRAFAGFWLLALVGFPAFALAWGYAGAWLRRWIRRSRGPDPGA
jgi:hypothetical protein